MTNNNKPSKSELAPLDIARETFKQMAMRRVVPTPDNYQLIYNEIAGLPVKETFDTAFRGALKQLPNETTEQSKWLNRWEKLLKQENWSALPALLNDGMDTSVTFSKQWPDAIRELLQSWDAKQVGLDLLRKKEALEKVLINFGNDPLLAQKIQTMANSWKQYGTIEASSKTIELAADEAAADNVATQYSQYSLVEQTGVDQSIDLPVSVEPALKTTEVSVITGYESDQFQETFRALQDMLKQSLNHGLIPRLDGYPDLKEEAEQIFALSEKARKLKDWQAMTKQFRAFLVRVEVIGANEDDMKQDLLRLLKLLVDNIGE
ncbi:MAG: GGDEF domain-containing protein, partial [Methylotenera sp.]|nr:GGDEF domain-containing protein [Methylotenera sp.]